MIEKVKSVNNPLTIIAIFSALAEVAVTVSLTMLPAESQRIFIWFAMIFPVLILGMFFYTLLRKTNVLYAPSDFKSDESFLQMLNGATKTASKDIDKAEEAFNTLKKELRKVDNETAYAKIEELLNDIENKLDSAKSSVEEIPKFGVRTKFEFTPAITPGMEKKLVDSIMEVLGKNRRLLLEENDLWNRILIKSEINYSSEEEIIKMLRAFPHILRKLVRSETIESTFDSDTNKEYFSWKDN